MSGRRIIELADARSVVYILPVFPGLQADYVWGVERGGSALSTYRERATGVSVSLSVPEGPDTLCLVEEDIRV